MTDMTASYLLKEQDSGGAFVEDPASPTNTHGGLRFNHPTGHKELSKNNLNTLS